MSDVLRVVTLSSGGRPVEVLNLNSAPGTLTAYFREKGTFQYTPAPSTVQWSKTARRYGGARAVGETHDNATMAWTAYVRGATLLAATQNVEALLQTIADEARGRYVEWAPEGGLSSFMEIAGPGTWTPTYDPIEFVTTNAMRVQLAFPVLPLVQWAPISIFDDFSVDSRTDYTFDAATSSDVAISAGTLNPNVGAGVTVERRARHTSRGYTLLEGQQSVVAHLGSVVTSFKAGALLHALNATNYIEVYLDDNGTNSRLRIDVVVAGVRTNRATVNLGVRMATSSTHGVRGRIEGSVVIAEHYSGGFTGGPLATPTTTTSYTLVSGDAPLNTTAGYSGWSIIPQSGTAWIDDFDFQQAWRNLTWPRTLSPKDPIPGTAPALVDVTITQSGGAAAPVFALLGWTPRPATPVAGFAPFSVNPAAGTGTGVTAFTNWVSTADATGLSGTVLKDATVSGIETYTATWLIDPSAMVMDDYSASELTLEVWVRTIMSNGTVVTPTAVLSARSPDGLSFGAERFTNEWGSTGVVLPAVGLYEISRLGTITVPADPVSRRTVQLWLTLTTGASSTGVIICDYIIVLPARSRALSPTGKHFDATYPAFFASTSQTAKTIRSDLSGMVASPPNPPMMDHGLGGSLIEPPPGAVDWLLKLGSKRSR
jgi:hypothetical protein